MKKFWLPLLTTLGMALGMATAQAAPTAPDKAVQETTEKMRSLIVANHQAYKADKAQFYTVVDEVLAPRFDVRYIAQLVLGRNWKAATPAQRTRFAETFKNSLIRNYADALLDNYDTVEARFQPLRMTGDETDVTVKSELKRNNGRPINVGFAMRLVDNEWKVYDVIIENLSLVTNFRSQFNEEIKKTGIDGLITRIETGEAVKSAADAAAKS